MASQIVDKEDLQVFWNSLTDRERDLYLDGAVLAEISSLDREITRSVKGSAYCGYRLLQKIRNRNCLALMARQPQKTWPNLAL